MKFYQHLSFPLKSKTRHPLRVILYDNCKTLMISRYAAPHEKCKYSIYSGFNQLIKKYDTIWPHPSLVLALQSAYATRKNYYIPYELHNLLSLVYTRRNSKLQLEPTYNPPHRMACSFNALANTI